MTFIKLCSIAVLVILAIENGYAFAAVNDLALKGGGDRPSVISISSLQAPSTEALILKPYKADMSQLKDELELYRKFYLLFALFQGYVLIKAVSR